MGIAVMQIMGHNTNRTEWEKSVVVKHVWICTLTGLFGLCIKKNPLEKFNYRQIKVTWNIVMVAHI